MKAKMTGGMILVLAVSCWLLPSKLLSVTNEERIQMLDDKFIKGEISEEAYNRLLKKYGGATEPAAAKPATAPVKDVPGNLVKNFSFENLASDGFPEGWAIQWKMQKKDMPNKFQRIEVSTSEAHDGEKSMSFSCSPVTYGTDRVFQELPLKPGKKYKVVFWAKGKSLQSDPKADGTPCVVVLEYKAKDGKLKPLYIEPKIGNEWKIVAKVVKIPGDALEGGQIGLNLYYASGILWIDDVVVAELP